MLWTPHPMSLHRFPFRGVGDIGDVTDRENRTGRVGLETVYVLIGVKIKVGSGGNLTTLSIKRWHPSDGLFQFKEVSISDDDVVADSNYIHRIAVEDYSLYTYNTDHNGEELVLEGTNAGSIQWEAEIILADAESPFNRTFTT